MAQVRNKNKRNRNNILTIYLAKAPSKFKSRWNERRQNSKFKKVMQDDDDDGGIASGLQKGHKKRI